MAIPGKDDLQNEPDPSGSGASGSSALDLLEQDHREVEGYFEQYEAEGADKDAIALKICLALEVHARIEEEIFYPAAREAIEEPDLIDEGLVEHESAKQLIADIEAMQAGDELHDAKVKVLAEQIRHHIEEEQNQLFPQLRQADLDLDTLGAKLARRKAELFQELAEGGEVT